MPADEFLSLQRAHPRLRRVPEDLDARIGALLRRFDQPARLAVRDLHADAADLAGDRRAPFPERLADRQAEALTNGLLDHGSRTDLERVHLDGADVVQVREDEDVRI